MKNSQENGQSIDKWLRLRSLAKALGLKSLSALAAIAGIDRSLFTRIKSGDRPLSADTIEKIVDAFPNVNSAWLLTGEGNMFSAPVSEPLTAADQAAIRVARKKAEMLLEFDAQTQAEFLEELAAWRKIVEAAPVGSGERRIALEAVNNLLKVIENVSRNK